MYVNIIRICTYITTFIVSSLIISATIVLNIHIRNNEKRNEERYTIECNKLSNIECNNNEKCVLSNDTCKYYDTTNSMISALITVSGLVLLSLTLVLGYVLHRYNTKTKDLLVIHNHV